MNELPTFSTAENGQTSFNWQERNRHRNDRLFFCHLMERTIADPVALQAAAWRKELGLRGKIVAGRMHISLVGLGDHDGLPEGLVELAGHIGSMIVAKPFNVSFDRLSAFGGGALVLRSTDGSPSLQEFWRNLTAVISYHDDDDAVKIANDTVYGLAAYVQSGDIDHARKVAARLRAGQVSINYPEWDTFAPFGGYKQSGNGREYADWAIHDFLEVKGIIGYGA